MTIPGNVRLFAHIAPQDLEKLLSCLSIRRRSFSRGETVLHEGDPLDAIGLVLFGRIQICETSMTGRGVSSPHSVRDRFSPKPLCAPEKRCVR